MSSVITYNLAESKVQQSQPSKEFFSVSINPSEAIQLVSGEVQFFSANVSDNAVPNTYSWSVIASKKECLNSTNYLLLAYENQAYFKFLDNSIEFCWLSVTATTITSNASCTVTVQQVMSATANSLQQGILDDQTFQSQNYFTTPSGVSSARFIVLKTGDNKYEVINGSDGNTISDYSSTSANTTLNKAIALGGTIAIKSGNYSGAELIVPANANIISEPGVNGIKYASIASGARIDEPTFNAAFGSYVKGDYTIAADKDGIATHQPSYLAFKSDRTICWQSTNASYVMLSALGAMKDGGDLVVVDPILLDSTILIDKSITLEFTDFGDTNNPNVLFSGTGNVFTINSSLIGKYAGKEITLRNIRIDGQGKGNNGIEIAGTTSIYVYDVKINNMRGIGFYSHGRGVFLRGTTITTSTNNKEGFAMISGQIDMQLIFSVGNGGKTYPNAAFKDVGPGFIGRLVASGGAGKVSHYGAYFVSGNSGLTIGTLHLEQIADTPLKIGENEAICGLKNSLIETIFLYNSNYGYYTGYPITINNAASLTIGSISERNINSTYTYDHSLLVFNVTAITIQTLDVQKDVYRSTYTNDNETRILIGYETEYP